MLNILFLTITKVDSIKTRGIYTDLIRELHKKGHSVYVVAPRERRERRQTSIYKEEGVTVLNIRTLNLKKTNVIEKGIGTLLIEYQFLSGIKRYFSAVKFDLILYSTPPITFYKVIAYIKQRDRAYTYLLLKDIFPQNAVDMGMMKKDSLLHKFFKRKERKLYEISNTIGCMSERNKDYVIAHNPYLEEHKVEVNPNSIEPIDIYQDIKKKNEIRLKHNIPINKTVFIYGGNLGIPQGVDFLLDTISQSIGMEDILFLIIGSGTQFKRIQEWFDANKPSNALLLTSLPKDEYDRLLAVCDVGLIFLDKRFTIPNFPSRFLSYLENRMPVLAATDPNTDLGKIIEQNHCGYWVLSGDKYSMKEAILRLNRQSSNFEEMRCNAFNLLMNEYTVKRSCSLIESKICTGIS